MSERVLSRAELVRATLARQLLLERSGLPVPDALEHLVGLQAQTPDTWYTGLWSRLDGFDPLEASALLEQRRLVRIALMRSTIHLVTAEDALRLRPLMQPAVEKPMGGRGRTELRARGLDDIATAGRALLEAEPLTNAALGAKLAERWPDESRDNLVMAVRVSVPLVQVTPRGMWGRSGATKHAPLESWLGLPLDRSASIDDLVRRYLAAFGPASPADMQVWSGLTKLAAVFERLRPELAAFRAPSGRELFDLPDAPRPPAETPAPPRFLYDFDNLLLSHADRSRFVTDERRSWMLSVTQRFSYGSLLVDGTVTGVWRIETESRSATLTIRLAEKLPAEHREAVAEEGAKLLDLWRPGHDHDVRFTLEP